MFGRCLLLLTAFAAIAAEDNSKWTPEFSTRLKTVADVTPSPDGKLIAWTEGRVVIEAEKSETNTQIFLAHSDGSGRLQLTRGEKSSTSPQFSPDGSTVYFASERSGKRGFYRIPIDGGEAEAITIDASLTPAAFQLSPNGKWIAFTSTAARPAIEQAKKEKRDFRVIDEDPANLSLCVISTDGDRHPARALVSGPFSVGAFDWSPDSRSISYETRPNPTADVNRKSDLSEVDLESGKTRVIAASEATESLPHYSPDGRYLAFVRAVNTPGKLAPARVVLFTRANDQSRELPASFDESPNLLGWSHDSKRMFFAEARGVREVLYAMAVDGPPSAYFTPKGTFTAARLNHSGTYAGLVLQSPAEAVEAYALNLEKPEPVRVSAANSALKLPPVGETSVVRWKAKDGVEIEGLLTLPPAYSKGTKIPMILNIHGGPSGVFSETFIGAFGLYPIASFASQGYAVLRVNPRGSAGYSHKFRASNINDWGGGDYQDIMSGVDKVIAMGIADPNRLAVMGWSYGGYMTNWVITQTTRFKCAASGAGLSNLISMWGTNDIPSTLDDYFTGAPMEQPERYVKMSPLYYLKNVTTPTLFLHGEIDPRVPTTQGYEMYHGLKRRGIETTMVVYPRTQHGPQEPKFVLDIMQRHLEWAAKHL